MAMRRWEPKVLMASGKGDTWPLTVGCSIKRRLAAARGFHFAVGQFRDFQFGGDRLADALEFARLFQRLHKLAEGIVGHIYLLPGFSTGILARSGRKLSGVWRKICRVSSLVMQHSTRLRRGVESSKWPARQREKESGPAVHLPFRPDLAAMTMHQPLHGRQTNAAPLEFLVVMQPLKDTEEPVRIFGSKPAPLSRTE